MVERNNAAQDKMRSLKKKKQMKEDSKLRTRTVLFVENTPGGGLAKSLREIMERIQNILGYRVKIVERAGTPLKLLFPLSDLGEGDKCGRQDCITCEQPGGEEKRPKCKKRSILYENICTLCNPGAGDRRAKIVPPKEVPSIYVGESAKSIQ